MGSLPPNHPWRLRARAQVARKARRVQRLESVDIDPVDEFAEVRTDPVIQRPDDLEDIE